MSQVPDPPPIPTIAPHPELIDLYHAIASARIPVRDAYTKLRALVESYLWPTASQKHGEFVGEFIVRQIWAADPRRSPRATSLQVLLVETVKPTSAVMAGFWSTCADEPTDPQAADHGVASLNAPMRDWCGDDAVEAACERIADYMRRSGVFDPDDRGGPYLY